MKSTGYSQSCEFETILDDGENSIVLKKTYTDFGINKEYEVRTQEGEATVKTYAKAFAILSIFVTK